jgi:hypothetical protein
MLTWRGVSPVIDHSSSDVRAELRQHLDQLNVSLVCRPVERRNSMNILRLLVHAELNQRLDRLHVPVACRLMQRSLSAPNCTNTRTPPPARTVPRSEAASLQPRPSRLCSRPAPPTPASPPLARRVPPSAGASILSHPAAPPSRLPLPPTASPSTRRRSLPPHAGPSPCHHTRRTLAASPPVQPHPQPRVSRQRSVVRKLQRGPLMHMVGHPCMERDHHVFTRPTAPPPPHAGPILGSNLIPPAGGPRTAMRPPHLLHHLTRVHW